MSTQADLAAIYGRELDRLAEEIRAYRDEADLWSTRGGQKNSPGTLALHLCGNLDYYVGAALGGTGYVRDRPAEFSARVGRDELLSRVASTREVVTRVLADLPDEVLEGVYPGDAPERMRGVGTRAFLLHLLWHLGWHLGHIYYHRLGAHSG